MTTSHDATLQARTDALASALELAGPRLDGATARRVGAAVEGVRQRLALGVDHTVVALAGGTGSGKSSLFNKVSRLTFADVGVKRPTTARVTACSWSAQADPLLDWIGVDRERRIAHSEDLEGDGAGALSGLVLLDLPDHDSVEPAHREVVDRVLPLVDLLVWVVDPQKYADDALHSGYLRAQVGSESSMVVLLNQVDTVPETQRENLVEDLDRLLADDGLEGVHVQPVSARTGEGVSRVREILEEACERRSVAAGRAAAELDAAALALLAQVPADTPWQLDAAVDRELEPVVVATGLDQVANQVGAAVRNGYGAPELPAPDRDAIALSRARWLTRAGAPLRPGWQRSLAESVAGADALRADVTAALRDVDLDVRGPASSRALRRASWVCLGLGVVLAVVGILALTGVLALDDPWGIVVAAGGGLLLVAAGALAVTRSSLRKRLAARRAAQVREQGRAAVRGVLVARLGEPTQRVLAEQRQVRELALSAREEQSARPLTGALRLPTGAELPASSTGSAAGQDTAGATV
ncbi:50S ribosome-binding GTPase [Isoptericola jiangsuensis]|uniref:50S ribosome-binding GTPase n=1 Tax=Isoptericola jiangsuensis TaxID=548579 RepID=A0A2A9EUT5_9MICO|nr:GTPase [Isoptericola jiangsuensis]PFG42648.1 50S ribosome-binding GTPase [Isoptericola jiangsuensis]